MSNFVGWAIAIIVLLLIAGFFLWRYKKQHPEGYAEHRQDIENLGGKFRTKPPSGVPGPDPVKENPPNPTSTKYEDWVDGFGVKNGAPAWVRDRWMKEHGR